jgi:hypothetical protein
MDALATLGSQMAFECQKIDITINKRMEPIIELLKKEFKELSLDQEDWRMPHNAKLMSFAAATNFKRNQGLHFDIRRSLRQTSWRSFGTVY